MYRFGEWLQVSDLMLFCLCILCLTDTRDIVFSCDCTGSGYTGVQCNVDINECATSNGGCQTTCVNRPGFFFCVPTPINKSLRWLNPPANYTFNPSKIVVDTTTGGQIFMMSFVWKS